jgi:predicted phage terminase large subunit-like protein
MPNATYLQKLRYGSGNNVPKIASKPHTPTEAAIDAALARKFLKHFMRGAWSTIEPGSPLIWGWHLDVLCDAIQKTLTTSDPQNLLINIFPGSGKSLVLSVFAVAWRWIDHPEHRFLCLSGNDAVSTRDSLKCRDVIRSEWYQDTFKPKWKMVPEQDAKTLYANTARGWRKASSMGADVTGERADTITIDDPIDAKDAPSKPKRDTVLYQWDQGIANRVNDAKKSTRIVIAQRLHEEDLPGHLIEQGTFQILCLPSEYEAKHPHVSALDIRTVEGELLFPARFPADVLEQEKKRLGSSGYAGQHQQRPAPAGGGMVKAAWFRFYRQNENDPAVQSRPWECSDSASGVLPEDFDSLTVSMDAAFKDGDDNDFVAIQLWGRKGVNKYLLNRFKKRVGFVESTAAVLDMVAIKSGKRGKKARKVLIEDRANGSAIIEVLRKKVSGVLAVNPEGGKESRVSAVSPQIEAGNVYLPDGAGWLGDYVGEWAGFPNAAHDDEVDATSQYLLSELDNEVGFASKFKAAVANGTLFNGRLR